MYVPALLLLAGLTWWRLDLALPLVLLFCPFFMVPKQLGLDLPLGSHHFRMKELSPSELLLLLDVLIAVAQTVLPATRSRLEWGRVLRSPFLPPAALFVLAGIASTVAAAYRHDALEWFRWTFPEPVAYFGLLLAVRGGASRLLVTLSIVGAGVLAGAVALLDFWRPLGSDALVADATTRPRPGVYTATGLARAHDPYGSGDNLGLLFDRSIVLWAALCLLARRRRLWWPLALIFVPALIFTYSRGAWLAIVIAVLLLLCVLFPWGRWLALGLLVLAGLVAVGGGAYVVHAFQAGHAGTIEQRLKIWKSAGAMIRDHPVLGVGPDNFIHYFAPTRKENLWQRECEPGRGYIQPDAGQEPCLSHPHNEILDFWLTSGILGLLSFVWLQIAFWRKALPSLSPRAGARRDLFVVGASGAMVAALLHGLVDQSYFLPDLALIFWALCMLVSPSPTEEALPASGSNEP